MPALAAEIHRRGVDAVVIVGDVSHVDTWIERAIRSFQVIAPQVAYVPGNHDVWQSPEAIQAGANTWDRYRDGLRALTTELGATYLPASPLRLGSAAVVGTCGWYDYGFLLEAHRDLMTGERRQTKQLDRYQWSDARFVAWRDAAGEPMDDADVLDVMLRELDAQLAELEADPSVQTVLVATHHLPCEEVVLRSGTLPWEFFNAFMGSPRIGEVALRYDKVTSIAYGHTHHGRTVTVRGRRVAGTPLGYPRERPGMTTEEVVQTRIAWWDL